MNRVRHITETVCMIAVAGMVCFVLYRTGQAVSHFDQFIVQEKTELHGTSQNLNAALIQIGLTTDEVRRAALEQRGYWRATSKDTAKLIAHTDESLNGEKGLLPDAHHALMAITLDTHDLLTQATNSAEQLTVAANSTLDAGTHDLDLFGMRIGDQRIDDTLTHWDAASLNLSLMTADGHLILQHGDHIMDYYDHALTTPLGFTKTLFKGLLGIVPAGADVYSAVAIGGVGGTATKVVKQIARKHVQKMN